MRVTAASSWRVNSSRPRPASRPPTSSTRARCARALIAVSSARSARNAPTGSRPVGRPSRRMTRWTTGRGVRSAGRGRRARCAWIDRKARPRGWSSNSTRGRTSARTSAAGVGPSSCSISSSRASRRSSRRGRCWSTMAASSSSRPPKWWWMAPVLRHPAALVTSASDTPSIPREAKSRSPASRRRSRVGAVVVVVMGSTRSKRTLSSLGELLARSDDAGRPGGTANGARPPAGASGDVFAGVVLGEPRPAGRPWRCPSVAPCPARPTSTRCSGSSP